MRVAVLLGVVLLGLSGCAARDVHGDKYRCDAGTYDPRCAPRKPPDHSKDIVYCEGQGIMRRCGWITRDQLDDLIRSMPGR